MREVMRVVHYLVEVMREGYSEVEVMREGYSEVEDKIRLLTCSVEVAFSRWIKRMTTKSQNEKFSIPNRNTEGQIFFHALCAVLSEYVYKCYYVKC